MSYWLKVIVLSARLQHSIGFLVIAFLASIFSLLKIGILIVKGLCPFGFKAKMSSWVNAYILSLVLQSHRGCSSMSSRFNINVIPGCASFPVVRLTSCVVSGCAFFSVVLWYPRGRAFLFKSRERGRKLKIPFRETKHRFFRRFFSLNVRRFASRSV